MRPSRQAYDKMLLEQDEILDRMMIYMQSMKSAKTGFKIAFQKGIISNINGLRILHCLLKEQHDVDIVHTRKLNKDDLEHFFSIIRFKGTGLNDHPTPLGFKYRLRNCIAKQMQCERDDDAHTSIGIHWRIYY